MEADEESYDVVIIGGGINGVGIARDAAVRGMRVLLLEASDFGSGTSSWSSRLIHGGLRYLEYGEVPLVFESLHERRTLLDIAPHLVKPLRLIIPLYRGGHRAPWLVRLGMLAYDILSFRKSLPRHRMLSAAEVAENAASINRDGLRGGASYYDAQVRFAERLVIENVIAAAAAGADVRNYSPVTELEVIAEGDNRVRFVDGPDGPVRDIHANCVVNATGPWVDKLLAQSDMQVPPLMGGTKGSHIVVSAFAGAPQDAFYVEAPRDGRPVFIIPWNDQYLIGTTDIRYRGDPGDARASVDEVDYLLDTVNTLFPGAELTHAAINFSYAGIRPLPRVEKGPEGAITRRHIIFHHEDTHVLSVIGGKLTTYRHLAEQVVDSLEGLRACKSIDCTTSTTPLPGGAQPAEYPAALPQLSDSGKRRLLDLYGARVTRLAELCVASPALAGTVAPGCEVLAGEVVMAMRDEFARTLIDLCHRRLMIGLSADQGRPAIPGIAAIAKAEHGWSDARLAAEIAALEDYNRRLREPAVSNGATATS